MQLADNPGATSRAPARSTTRSCSGLSTPGLRRLDRLRVQAGGHDRRRPGLDHPVPFPAGRRHAATGRPHEGRIYRPRHHGHADGWPSGGGRPRAVAGDLRPARHTTYSTASTVCTSPTEVAHTPTSSSSCCPTRLMWTRSCLGRTASRPRALAGRHGGHRYEFDRSDRDQGFRRRTEALGGRLPSMRRCSGGPSRRARTRVTDDHGRLADEATFAEVTPLFELDGQECITRGRSGGLGPDCQGRQPDHRRPEHRGGERGASLRVQGRRRPGTGAGGADGWVRGQPDSRSAWPAHDRPDVRYRLSHPAASEGASRLRSTARGPWGCRCRTRPALSSCSRPASAMAAPIGTIRAWCVHWR